MRKTLIASFVLALTFVVSGAVHADLLTGEAAVKETFIFHKDGTSNKSVYLSPMSVYNKDTKQSFITFCGDYTVSTSDSFRPGAAGQKYTPVSMADSRYTAQQQRLITDLFGYTYSTAFDVSTGEIDNQVLAQAMQLVLWEILTETTGQYSITSGSFYGTNLTDSLVSLTTSLFNALVNDVWDPVGDFHFTQYTNYNMTVYDGGTASQTQISITAPTPEPGTMLIVGLGMAAAFPVLRRRMKKNA